MKRKATMVSERGTGSLATVFTVFTLVSFVLLFSNLSQYVASRAALQKAADRAARCVAATEAGCVVEEITGEPAPSVWFGSPASTEVSVYAQTGDYSVTIPHTTWSTQVSRWQVRSERHSLNWNEWQIPVTRVVGMLNSWAVLKAKVQVNLRGETSGNQISCVLDQEREIPYGLDFSTPATYFDVTWCGDPSSLIQRVKDESSCKQFLANATESYVSSVVPSWGTYCSVMLPGVSFDSNGQPVFANEQPWLLLGGEAVCDGTGVANDPPLDQAPTSKQPAVAFPGDVNRPFPMTVDRQYVVIDVVSCESANSISSRLESLFPADTDASRMAGFLNASKEISGSQFSEYEFSALDPIGDDEQHSLFIYQPDRSTSSVALPKEYNWTFLRWERQVERSDQNGNQLSVGSSAAERTVLKRKICGWHTWEEAQAANLSGLDNARPLKSAIRLLVDDGSCGSAVKSDPVPSYRCENLFYTPIGGDFDQCEGWSTEKLRRTADYRNEQERLVQINSSLPGISQLLPASSSDIVEPDVQWSQTAEQVQWNNALVVDDSVDESYRQTLSAIELSVATPDLVDGTSRLPQNASWISALQEQGIDKYLGWKEFISDPQLDVASEEQYLEVFENLVPDSYGQQLPILVTSGGDETYDFNLDCQTESACDLSGSELKGRLWELVKSEYSSRNARVSLPGLAGIEFNISPKPTGYYSQLGTFRASQLADVRSALPACAAVQTSCRRAETLNAPLEYAGLGKTPPHRCQSGELLNCFAVTDIAELSQLPVSTEVDVDLAKSTALAEFADLFPGSSLADNCSTPRCLAVDVEQETEHVQVTAKFAMPLQFPLNAILDSPYIQLEASASEALEVALTK